MVNKFNIGDKVWYSQTGSREKFLTCPDCFGQRALTVILGDGSKIIIPCDACSYRSEHDYEAYPTGSIKYYEWFSEPEQVTIDGMEIFGEKVEYRSSRGGGSYWRLEQDRIFLTEEEARAKSEEISIEHNAKEVEKITKKEYPKRTWAFNISYHRKRIKDCERDLIYHKSKLDGAKFQKKTGGES